MQGPALVFQGPHRKISKNASPTLPKQSSTMPRRGMDYKQAMCALTASPRWLKHPGTHLDPVRQVPWSLPNMIPLPQIPQQHCSAEKHSRYLVSLVDRIWPACKMTDVDASESSILCSGVSSDTLQQTAHQESFSSNSSHFPVAAGIKRFVCPPFGSCSRSCRSTCPRK